ncbi:mitochondrial inner membrane protease subunit 2 isoform X3 [Emydura macquarii macquarii]|uniref:mitochondrial inner membrane protease subunit 2 isoform X3 n=1 Tax=Emydura macquarii macquarii TaxID=1129001 RepID=UPI00352AA6CB
MAQAQGLGRRYIKAFFRGFFIAVPVTVTFLDKVACVARVEGASMQPSLNPGGRQVSDIVLLNHWSVRNYEVQRGDIVSLVSAELPLNNPFLLDLASQHPCCEAEGAWVWMSYLKCDGRSGRSGRGHGGWVKRL